MFTRNNTFSEIMKYPKMEEYLPVYYDDFLINYIPEDLADAPLEEVEQRVVMPWGFPYNVDELLMAANQVVDILEKKAYQLIPLWYQSNDYNLDSSKIGKKESVCLITKKEDNKGRKTKPAVIICPGGGYETKSMVGEGSLMAEQMEQAGYRAFTLYYRVNPNRYPEPQKDLALAIMHVRANADMYGVDAGNLMIMGSSAGAHLCALVAAQPEKIKGFVLDDLEKERSEMKEIFENISAKPNKVCLNYPVISFEKEQHEDSFVALTGKDESLRTELSVENLVDETYPKCFVWACEDDSLVPVANSKMMGEALDKHHVEHQLCIYPTGGHGCGLAKGTSAESWSEEMLQFMK